MKCGFCGGEVKDGDSFCTGCGAHIVKDAASASINLNEQDASAARINFERSSRVTKIATAIIVSALFLLYIFLFMYGEVGLALVGLIVPISIIVLVTNTLKREKNCFVVITDTTIYGTVPKSNWGTKTKNIEVKISEIEKVKVLGTSSKGSNPRLYLIREAGRVDINSMTSSVLWEIKDEVDKRIAKINGKKDTE